MSQAERAAAAVMRRHLLPARLPSRSTDLEFAARYVAGGGGQVGGDWYDVFTLPSGTVCLVVGDVVGHGLAAAQSMSQIRAALRAIALHTDNPAEVLSLLDEHVRHFQLAPWPRSCWHAHPRDRYAVPVLGRAPTRHPRPAPRQGHDPDDPADLLLGVEAGHPRHRTDVPLPPGSVLCLYSDGLVERRDSVIDDNIEKFRTTVTATRPSRSAARSCGD